MTATKTTVPVAVFLSGGGRSLQNLIDHQQKGMLSGIELRLALSSSSKVRGVEVAANAGIEVPKMPDLYLNLQQLTGQTVNDGFDEEVQLTQGVLGPSSPIPTPCLLLKNAFDPDKERAAAAAADEPIDWEREIEDDFRDECSKFGTVVFTHLDPASKGFVYLKFGDTRSATAAQAALHGRWFNMKRLMAEYQFDTLFDAHFGLK